MRSLAHGATVRGVAAGRAVILIAVCGVNAVAVGDDGAGLLAGVGVIAGEALGETGYVGKRAGAAAAAHVAVVGTNNWTRSTSGAELAGCHRDRARVRIERACLAQRALGLAYDRVEGAGGARREQR